MKLDVRKYFDSIDHDVMKQLLSRRFKDYQLLEIFDAIVDSYHCKNGKGLPIGNLTSQYFANHYLSTVDDFVKDDLKVPGYIRYMANMVLWSNEKDELLKMSKELERFLSDVLFLQLKPFCLHKREMGLRFCGYIFFKEKLRLNKTSCKRFISKTKEYTEKRNPEIWDQKKFQEHILPLFAFVKKANTHGFRRKLLERLDQG